MTQNRLADAVDVQAAIAAYKTRDSLTNCFLLPAEIERICSASACRISAGPRNLFILEQKESCVRIHYIINDTLERPLLEAASPLMLEILYRGKENAPAEAVDYWLREGFRENLVRDNLSAICSSASTYAHDNALSVENALSTEDADFARSLFDSLFDPYSSDRMTPAQARQLIDDGQLLIARINGRPVGALHHYLTGKCAWIGHVGLSAEARGKRIGTALVEEFIRLYNTQGITRFSLWVQALNAPANAMYSRLGFRYAGKSTLSLIKLNPTL